MLPKAAPRVKTPVVVAGSLLMAGNRTECALLGLVHRLGVDYQEIRDLHPECGFTHVFPFNPETKLMSTVVPTSWGGFRMFTKGAPESVLVRTSFILMANVEEKPFDEAARCQTNDVLRNMACSGLRAIALATRKFDSCRDWCDECQTVRHLTLIAIASIDDPLRCDISECAKRLACAGVQVKLLTGETLLTAQTMAHKSGIYDPSDPNQLALTCKDWNQALCHKGSGKMDVNVMAASIPRLKVLSRCSPLEKFRIIRALVQMEENCCGHGDIIAVTGHSLHDAAALKVADVGIALSSGTDVAKEAADIILLDDSFGSILKAVQWGRMVYDNVSKFVQFQLTANIVLLVVMLVVVLIGHWTPFTPMQLLWINLIIDVFGAVALATDPPDQQLLNRCPYKRYRSIMSRVMKVNIFGQALFQIVVLLVFWFFGWSLLGSEYLTEEESFRAGGVSNRFSGFSDFPTGTILTYPNTYPWVQNLSNFPNNGEPFPLQPKPLQSMAAAAAVAVNKTIPADPFWLSFWTFLNFNPNAWGCMPMYWYTQCMTFIFNLFVIMTLFNLINSRKIHAERNKLNGITKNKWFIAAWFFVLLSQIIIVEAGYDVIGTRALGWNLWMVSFFFGFMVLVWQQVLDSIVRISKCYDNDEAPLFGWGTCCGDHMTQEQYNVCYSPKNASQCPDERKPKAMPARSTCPDTSEHFSFSTSTHCGATKPTISWGDQQCPKPSVPTCPRPSPQPAAPCSKPFSVCSTAPASPSPYVASSVCVPTPAHSAIPVSSTPCASALPPSWLASSSATLPSAPPAVSDHSLYPSIEKNSTLIVGSGLPLSPVASNPPACPLPADEEQSPSPEPPSPSPTPINPSSPVTARSPGCVVKENASILSRPPPPGADGATARKRSKGEKSGKSGKKRQPTSSTKTSDNKPRSSKKDGKSCFSLLSDDRATVITPSPTTDDAAVAVIPEMAPPLAPGPCKMEVGVTAVPICEQPEDPASTTVRGGEPSFPCGFLTDKLRRDLGINNAVTTATTVADETVVVDRTVGHDGEDGADEERSTKGFENVEETVNAESTLATTTMPDNKGRRERRRSSQKRHRKSKKRDKPDESKD